jgi:hypothetical protein
MSHQMPYYAQAPLGQTLAPTTSTAIATTSPGLTFWRVTSMAAGAALAYHGYKRNRSVGWALVWGLAGGIVWPAGLAIAFAQGFGKSATVARNGRRRSRRRRSTGR